MHATPNSKILITGGSGFIGQHLIPKLISQGEQLVLLKRRGASRDSIASTPLATIYDTDNAETLSNEISSQSIQGVIHLASCYLKNHKPAQIPDLIESNIHFPTRLVEACTLSSVKWFLNIGTIWQNYGDKDYSPVNLYAASKQAFQDILSFYAEAKNIKVLNLKLSDTYGPNDPRPKILNLLEQAARNKKMLDMSGGEQRIDILYIDDVVSGIIRSIDILKQEKFGNQRTYCLRAKEIKTLKEIVEILQNVLGEKININWGALSYSPREVMVPPTTDTVLPDWSPKFRLEDGLKKFCLK